MASTATALSTNGLIMPSDFPVLPYEAVGRAASELGSTRQLALEQFRGAWNAVSYRFYAMCEYERVITEALGLQTNGPPPLDRYRQERDIFGFFCNGFSVFESAFYAVFSIGAFLVPAGFPLSTPKEQQRISPTFTIAAMAANFPGDPILNDINALMLDPAYIEWREIRNILTHRAAPGRTFFVGFDDDEPLPDQWKIKGIILDGKMAVTRRAALSRLLTDLLQTVERFTSSRLPGKNSA
jgi:hypothetical protein